MFFLEYHDRGGGGGCPGWLKKKNLPRVISEIPGLPWKLELTQPLSLLQQARLENNDIMQQLKVKRNTVAGSIQPRLTPAVLRYLQMSPPLVD